MSATASDTLRIYVRNQVGCESTSAEGEQVIHYLKGNGHEMLPAPAGADYLVVNTCAFTGQHRERLVEALTTMTGEAPQAKLVIMGCAGLIAPSILKGFPTAMVCGHRDLPRLDSLFARRMRFRESGACQWSPVFKRTVVSIGRGCASHCSFCSIKRSIGHIKSRPIADILADIRTAQAAGERRFIAGDDLGAYGRDCGLRLADLLQAFEGLDGDLSLLLSNIHPGWFLEDAEEMGRFLASSRACRWLHLPIESANDQVLKDMKRDYAIGDVARELDRLLARVPDLRLYYDVIIGYPTESEQAFDETLSFIKRYPPSAMTVVPFSAEPGTAACGELKPLANETVIARRQWLGQVYELALQRDRRVSAGRWGDD